MNTTAIKILFVALVIIVGALLVYNAEKLSNKKLFLVFGGIVVLGFVLRLLNILYIPCEPISDYETMQEAAKTFADGTNSAFKMGTYMQRFPHMTPYAVFVGILYKIFGTDVFVVKFFNVLFKTAAIVILGFLGKRLCGKRGMLCTSFLYAVFPQDIFYTNVCITENFALPFLIASLLFVIKAFQSEGVKECVINMVISGAVLSVGCLFRGVAPFYLVAYAGAIILVFARGKKIVSILSMVLAFVLINQVVSLSLYYGKVTEYKLSDKGEPYQVYMLVGSNFETHGMYSQEDHDVYFEAGKDPEKAKEIATERLIQRLKNNPEKIIPLWIEKTAIIWHGTFDSVYWGVYNNGVEGEKPDYYLYNVICAFFFIALLVLGVVGIILNKNRKISIILLLLSMAFEAGLMLIEIQARYTFPVAYIFVVLAAVGICESVNLMIERRKNEKLS